MEACQSRVVAEGQAEVFCCAPFKTRAMYSNNQNEIDSSLCDS